jgi:RNA polymerase sigma factor (sigma-70 family)
MAFGNGGGPADDLLRHAGWLSSLARHLVNERDAADDLAQDTWIQALRRPPAQDRSLRPWLGTVARNLARMNWRSQRRRATREAEHAAQGADSLPSPEELLERQESQRIVANLVLELEEPYRSTILLCYSEGLSPGEVARSQHISAGTVRARLKRGLDELRRRVQTHYENDKKDWRSVMLPLAANSPRLAGGGMAASSNLRLPAALVAAGVLAAAMVALKGWQPDERSAVAGRADVIVPGVKPPRWNAATPEGEPTAGQSVSQSAPESPVVLEPSPPAESSKNSPLAIAASLEGVPVRGKPEAPVTLVAFLDYTSPFCRQAASLLRELAAAFPNDLRVAIKHLPVSEQAPLAAEAMMAAHRQGKFWAMHDRLLAASGPVDRAALERLAQAIALDMRSFRTALDARTFRADVEAQWQQAQRADISGAPTFLVNESKIVGSRPFAVLKHAVESEVSRLRGVSPPAPLPADLPDSAPRMKLAGHPWPVPRIVLPDEAVGPEVVLASEPHAPFAGRTDAPIEVVHLAFYDGRVGHRWNEVIEGLRRERGNDIRIVFRPASYAKRDATALNSEAAWAAHAQGKFWAMHEKLSSSEKLNRPALESMAQDLGLDLKAFREALDRRLYRDRVRLPSSVPRDFDLPALLVAGRYVTSSVALAQVLDVQLARLRRPLVNRDPTTVNLTPATEGYQPYRLNRYLSWPQIFALEPRDPAWASSMENAIGQIVLADIRRVAPVVTGLSFECRSTLCRLRWTASREVDDRIGSLGRSMHRQVGALVRATAGEQVLAYRLPGRDTETAEEAAERFLDARGRRSDAQPP